MKTSFYKISVTFLLVLFFSLKSNAQRFVVKVRPAAPVAVRIASPGPRHIWVDGEWLWRNGNYVYKPGYWHLPRGREKWVPGHWKRARGGWIWVPGHFRHRR
jgi:WXXGXW repeat (2 copies)